ncbi:MAG: metal-dependent transcriptional regulator [Solirubrobacteraceae bacterium]|nr:metal-dependent transcriptional regulator [Patulibacter sp.]
MARGNAIEGPGEDHPCGSSTSSTSRYLLAIFEVGRDEPRLTAAAVARKLEVSTPSAHEMLGRLEAIGLVERSPLRLTPDGMSAALVLSTRRRAAQQLAHDVLGLDDAAADAESVAFAATLSPVLGRHLVDWAQARRQGRKGDAPGPGAA